MDASEFSTYRAQRGNQKEVRGSLSLFGRRAQRGRRIDARALRAGRVMRGRLEADGVLRVCVDEVHHAVRPRATSFWLTTGLQVPTLAYDAGRSTEAQAPPLVRRAARRRRLAVLREDDHAALAAPVLGPHSGLFGVLYVEADEIGDDVEAFCETMAAEAGFCLETANLYEQAVAAKDKSDAILARVGDGVVVTDTRGRVIEWNDAAANVVGFPAASAVGRGCHETLGLCEGERPLDCRNGCPLLRSQDAARGVEVWRPHVDGRRQPLLVSAAVVRNPDGSASEIVHSLRDITRLKEADEAKTLFLATASHELKTPLTVIQGFAQLLTQAGSRSDDVREKALHAIENRAVQLNAIVDRLLLSGRIEAGRLHVDVAQVDVAPTVRERTEALALATGRDVSLVVPDHLPAALAEPGALATIVDHLLDNAVKYSPGGQSIEVRLDADEACVRLLITDHGIGMDAEARTRCFEKFWQRESSDVRRFAGTGIGLYIVKSLVEAMGGAVEVLSSPGLGSTFVVCFIRADAPPIDIRSRVDRPAMPEAGEPSVIREFMRQIGIPTRRAL